MGFGVTLVPLSHCVSVPLLVRTLSPSWGATLMTSPEPNYLPKATPPSTIPLGLCSMYEFEEKTLITLPCLVFDATGL